MVRVAQSCHRIHRGILRQHSISSCLAGGTGFEPSKTHATTTPYHGVMFQSARMRATRQLTRACVLAGKGESDNNSVPGHGDPVFDIAKVISCTRTILILGGCLYQFKYICLDYWIVFIVCEEQAFRLLLIPHS